MILVLDIGNTNIVAGWYEGQTLVAKWRILTIKQQSFQDYLDDFRQQLYNEFYDIPSLGKVIISSVVPELNGVWNHVIWELFEHKAVWVDKELYKKLDFEILNPDEIGSDLVANAYAAWKKHQKPCIVIDLGTAMTFTVVLPPGTIAGVAIAPGINTAFRSLFSRTSKLPDVSPEMPDSMLGKDSHHAMRAGIMIGYQGVIKEMITRAEQETGEKLVVIATGGLSSILAPHIKRIDDIQPDLTLEGLWRIAEFV
ncbi:MAG: type III pantothenate kinase [Bacteroidales bacterium]|nr:type III pantothenate kinase [Bacteroidales bacterium]